jgi:hypothetical protein
VLRDVKTIENRDALISWDKKILERDEHGKPLTRWDGETMKLHPVTGKNVPDEDARLEVERYVAPKAAKWPKADFIVGNPPFIGAQRLRDRLGDGYFEALFKTTDVPESADFVMHWWDKAALAVRKEKTRRLGFVTTNSITQVFSRRVIAKHIDAKDRVSLLFAIPDHPWVDEKGGAAVRIAMTVAANGKAEGRMFDVVDENGAPEQILFTERAGAISSDLRLGADVAGAKALKSNDGLGSMGVKLHGEGFILTALEAARFNDILIEAPIRTGVGHEPSVIFDFCNGRDLTARPRLVKVIDLFALSEAEVREQYPAIYQHLNNAVRPQREGQAAKSKTSDAKKYAEEWWLFGKTRPDFRKAVRGLGRYVGTTYTAKHRLFQFLQSSMLPESMVIAIATDDALSLGVLTSRIHLVWAKEAGGMLEDRPRYNKSLCFDPFPFPADVPDALKARIRTEAEALDALRKTVLETHADLTLTGLYNVLEALKAGRALTDKERDVHDRGLVTLIRQHHDAIDAAVAEAYGWPADLSDEEILTGLVALNRTRADEEAKGIIRWLRPEFQAPGAVAPQVNATLDLGDAPAAAPASVIPWPKTMAEQITAVAAILSASPTPQHSRDIARAFDGKRAATITPVLDALTAIGQARRLADGRYAA